MMFWSSVDLTGNQTVGYVRPVRDVFWSSVDLTGNQTFGYLWMNWRGFWSSVDLTGNQTKYNDRQGGACFGAVSI